VEGTAEEHLLITCARLDMLLLLSGFPTLKVWPMTLSSIYRAMHTDSSPDSASHTHSARRPSAAALLALS